MTPRKIKFIGKLQSTDDQLRNIYAEVGRAITSLSSIENWIAHIYHDYCDLATSYSMPFFYEQMTFEKKLKLTDLIVKMKAEEEHRKEWEQIISGIESHRAVRNLAAHYPLTVDEFRKGGPQAYLHPPWLKLDKLGKRKGRELEILEIRSAASALQRASVQLEKFFNDLQKYWYPEFYNDVEEEE